MNGSWSIVARYVARYRGPLLGGIGSAIAVAATTDPSAGIARSSIGFALWFALAATLLAVGLTTFLSVARYLASRPVLPRAIVRRRSLRA
jgi:hypothetical protein